MRVLVVDDETPARHRIKRLLQALPSADVAGEAGDGETALALAREVHPDVVLLDIRMPGMDGLDVARELAAMEPAPAVIFTTAFDGHALEAFDLEAVDYLVKPIRRERLARALARVAERQGAGDERGPYLRIHQRGGVRLLSLGEVYYFQADAKYVTAYHAQGEALLESSLKALEEQFGEALVRIHRNAVVPRERLVGIERDSGGGHRAVLEGCDDRPEISRRHAGDIKRLLEAVSAEP